MERNQVLQDPPVPAPAPLTDFSVCGREGGRQRTEVGQEGRVARYRPPPKPPVPSTTLAAS